MMDAKQIDISSICAHNPKLTRVKFLEEFGLITSLGLNWLKAGNETTKDNQGHGL